MACYLRVAMGKAHLSLVVHGHQPVGNFDSVFRSSYELSYKPFLDAVERHEVLRAALHFTGPLLDWLEANEPSYLERISLLASTGRVELLGGGLYEPILAVLPWDDADEQLVRMSDRVESITGRRPRGIWLAERVWEPELASTLAFAGVEYTILDDTHFVGAGLAAEDLDGIFVTEDRGQPVHLVPISRRLRHLIPYRESDEILGVLRETAARANRDSLLLMGDDIEKFGVWPGSHAWVFENRWIDRFAEALAGASDWLSVLLPTEAVDTLAPRGRVYLPTASYHEMTEWSMPEPATAELVRLTKLLEATDHDDARSTLRFLRGGFWRSFLAKYPESNTIHKRMLDVSARLAELDASDERWERAYDHLLRAQCNDGYWHGLFGGLYSPHLRAALYENLIHAEAIADEIEGRGREVLVEERDFDCDGLRELVVSTRELTAVVDPGDGGLPVFDFKTAGFALANTLQRRHEHYHATVEAAEPETNATPAGSILDVAAAAVETVARAVEAAVEGVVETVETALGVSPPREHERHTTGLASHVVYDHGPRNIFTVFALDPETSADAFASQRFDPYARVAGPCTVEREVKDDSTTLKLTYERPDVVVEQYLTFHVGRAEVTCTAGVHSRDGHPRVRLVVIECNLNLLAGNAHDRYYQIGSLTQPLAWRGELTELERLALVDEWQGLRIDLTTDRHGSWWCFPIYTVSLSEEGLERVYQGSSVSVVKVLRAGESPDYVTMSLSAATRGR